MDWFYLITIIYELIGQTSPSTESNTEYARLIALKFALLNQKKFQHLLFLTSPPFTMCGASIIRIIVFIISSFYPFFSFGQFWYTQLAIPSKHFVLFFYSVHSGCFKNRWTYFGCVFLGRISKSCSSSSKEHAFEVRPMIFETPCTFLIRLEVTVACSRFGQYVWCISAWTESIEWNWMKRKDWESRLEYTKVARLFTVLLLIMKYNRIVHFVFEFCLFLHKRMFLHEVQTLAFNRWIIDINSIVFLWLHWKHYEIKSKIKHCNIPAFSLSPSFHSNGIYFPWNCNDFTDFILNLLAAPEVYNISNDSWIW